MFSSLFSSTSHGPNPLWETRSSLDRAGAPLLDLTRTNPTSAGLTYPSDLPAILARPSVLRYRPDPKGLPEARRAVAAYLDASGAMPGHARPVDPDRLLLTSSTSEAYGFLLKLLCDPGDEILIPTPTYPLFDSLASLERVACVEYPLSWIPHPGGVPGSGNWVPDFAGLRNRLSTRTKALILVSPNNPTGHIAPAGELRGYLKVAEEYGLALILDEVFSEYLFPAAPGTAPAEKPFHPSDSDGPLVFTLNGLSKLAGLPQLKLGWIHVGGAPAAAAQALEHLEWIADAYLSVNTPVQEACADILARAPALRAPIQARLEVNLAAAESLLASPLATPAGTSPGAAANLQLLRPEGGWSLVLRVPHSGPGAGAGPELDRDEAFAIALLKDRGVHVHPGGLFGFREDPSAFHLVLSLLTPEDDFRQGLTRLLTFHRERFPNG
jgi:alanine-synthesizing transaminase